MVPIQFFSKFNILTSKIFNSPNLNEYCRILQIYLLPQARGESLATLQLNTSLGNSCRLHFIF